MSRPYTKEDLLREFNKAKRPRRPKGPPAQPVLEETARRMGGKITHTFMNGFAGMVSVPKRRR